MVIMTKKLLDFLCREERPIAAAAAAKDLRIRMRILGYHVSRCAMDTKSGNCSLRWVRPDWHAF